MTSRIDYTHPHAQFGRFGDSVIAHVEPGETIVPKGVMSDDLQRRLHQEMIDAGIPPERYTVGKGMSINPITGNPEFFKIGKVFKAVGKIVKVAAPVIGIATGNPWLAALAAGGGSLLSGEKLGTSLLNGFGAYATQGIGSGGTNAGLSGLSNALGGADTMVGRLVSSAASSAPSFGDTMFGRLVTGGHDLITGATDSLGLSDIGGTAANAAGDQGTSFSNVISKYAGNPSSVPSALVQNSASALPTAGNVANNASSSFLDNLWNKVSDNPFGAIGTALNAGAALGLGGEQPGAVGQDDLKARLDASAAQNAADNAAFMQALQKTGQFYTNPMSPDDYANYATNSGNRARQVNFQLDPAPAAAKGGLMPAYRSGGGVMSKIMQKPRVTQMGAGRFYDGQGGGQDDNLNTGNALLSPKEYVVQADTVADLGDGNPDHGAKILDMMAMKVRKHKATGKKSPKAKSPEAYMPIVVRKKIRAVKA